MRPFEHDYDDLDDLEFETFSPNRRPHRSKHHHKAAGHRRQKPSHYEQWGSDDWDEFDGLDSYDALEFDSHSGINTRY